ncbi:MAG: hypothetical protein OEQ53_16575 [Saprospiraceae bacterium]|nr:hypothetical protein [Saprospiraceae bacterium]
MIVHLISSPRTISTALMYSFAQRSDMKVMDEPYYGVYLSNSNVIHPIRSKILDTMPHQQDLVTDLILQTAKSSSVFVKNIASHFLALDPSFCRDWCNVFLIREPAQIISSFDKVISNPKMSDLGIFQQRQLFDWLTETSDRRPTVIDSNDILDAPAQMLERLCKEIGISFESEMLHWNPGPKPFDGIWAPYWYRNTHLSSGFLPRVPKSITLSRRLHPLHKEADIHYNYLYSRSISNSDYASKV